MQHPVAFGLGVAVRGGMTPFLLAMRWSRALRRTRTREPGDEAPWTASIASKMLLDEVFLASEFITGSVLAMPDAERAIAELAAAETVFAANGFIDDPRSYHAPPSGLEVIDVRNASSALGAYRHLVFRSNYRPHTDDPGLHRFQGYAANRTGHVWLLEHEGRPRPWLVCVPGYRMGTPTVDFAGFRARWLHEELGLNVAIPVLPLHGQRRIGRRSGDGFLCANFVDVLHAQAQATQEVRSLVAWLRDRGAPKIGLHGVSLGAYTAALVAAFEDDLACVIAGIPAVDYLALLRLHVPPALLRAAGMRDLVAERVERVMRVVSPLSVDPVVPRERRFVYAGRADQLAPPSQARALWRHWDRPEIAWYDGGHVSFLWESEVERLVGNALERSGMLRTRRPSLRVVSTLRR